MKIIRNTLVLILGFTSLTYANNNLQKYVGSVVLKVKNNTNKNYKITTLQQVGYLPGEPYKAMIPVKTNEYPLDGVIPAGAEKFFNVALLPAASLFETVYFFVRKPYLVDEAGNAQLEVYLEQLIRSENLSCEFKVVLNRVPLLLQSHYQEQARIDSFSLKSLDLTKGKADFVVHLTLQGDSLKDSFVVASATQK